MAKDLRQKIKSAIKKHEEGIRYWNEQINIQKESFVDKTYYVQQREKAETIIRELRLLLE